jgi:hypothetical protein
MNRHKQACTRLYAKERQSYTAQNPQQVPPATRSFTAALDTRPLKSAGSLSAHGRVRERVRPGIEEAYQGGLESLWPNYRTRPTGFDPQHSDPRGPQNVRPTKIIGDDNVTEGLRRSSQADREYIGAAPDNRSHASASDRSAFEKLCKRIRQGAGQGHLDEYVPLWQVTRANPTRFGSQQAGPMPGYHRASNFRLPAHREAALICLWAGALDVRENYPLWPGRHPHPLADWPLGTEPLHSCRGLLDLLDDRRQADTLRRRIRRGSHPQVTLLVTYGDPAFPSCLLLNCCEDEDQSQLSTDSGGMRSDTHWRTRCDIWPFPLIRLAAH